MHNIPLRRSDCPLRPRVRPAPLGGMPEKLPFYTLPKLARACKWTFPRVFFDQRDVCYEPVTHVVQAAPHRTRAPVAVPSSPCVLKFFETLTAGVGNGWLASHPAFVAQFSRQQLFVVRQIVCSQTRIAVEPSLNSQPPTQPASCHTTQLCHDSDISCRTLETRVPQLMEGIAVVTSNFTLTANEKTHGLLVETLKLTLTFRYHKHNRLNSGQAYQKPQVGQSQKKAQTDQALLENKPKKKKKNRCSNQKCVGRVVRVQENSQFHHCRT